MSILICYFFSSTLHSFGGGSEMMRDGDVMGLLHALDRARKYRYKFKTSNWLVFRQTDFIFVALSARVATFLSHVPWLVAMILSYSESISKI